ncbi:DUF3072 domain-containing protein [Nocardioides deserti]|uniref:DUF3072 domain-containing protein n=1 Tax=Nocardioides deserti TaxID=1588644 RepID=A0ABR6UCA8_9ACTN|nr:DUF3072 domain-containing protein [Nocardioides deserti]MBC2962067.1 DUF3072 domain-containing protein [Nocardioides deserti]GGO78926.1 hypothetical protein GCM10012276_37510 [Nocardioides deserti]
MTDSNASANAAHNPSADGDVLGAADGDVLGAAAPDDGSNARKDPADWVTADEPMTGAQRSYLDTLARQAGETLSADLTKAEASEHIDRLQESTGRGTDD